jgi:uncharacterized alkaline shock family protein YloU
MSEQKSQQRSQGGNQQSSPLKTERGQTTIQDGVVAKIAGIAAQEVEGIRMGGGASQAASGLMSSLTGSGGGGGQTRGVSVEVGEEEAAVDLTMTTEYGKSIPQLSEAVRRNVVNRIENLVGLRVTEVNITVSNIFFPQEEQDQQQLEEGQ